MILKIAFSGAAYGVDVEAAVIGISGVAAVKSQLDTGTIRIDYDPTYVSSSMLCRSVESAGYKVEEAKDA